MRGGELNAIRIAWVCASANVREAQEDSSVRIQHASTRRTLQWDCVTAYTYSIIFAQHVRALEFLITLTRIALHLGTDNSSPPRCRTIPGYVVASFDGMVTKSTLNDDSVAAQVPSRDEKSG